MPNFVCVNLFKDYRYLKYKTDFILNDVSLKIFVHFYFKLVYSVIL